MWARAKDKSNSNICSDIAQSRQIQSRNEEKKSIDNTLFQRISMYPFQKNPMRHAISSARFSVICIDHVDLSVNDTLENTVRDAQMVTMRVIQEKYYVYRGVLSQRNVSFLTKEEKRRKRKETGKAERKTGR